MLTGVYLGGVEFAVVQLQDAQGRLQVGLGLRQLQLDGPQAVGIRGGQVHPEQRQIHLKDRSGADRMLAADGCYGPDLGRLKMCSYKKQIGSKNHKEMRLESYLRLYCPRVNCCNVHDSTCGAQSK